MKSRIPAVAAAVAILLAVSPGGVLATGTLDQQQANTSGYTINWIPGVQLAQTFTAGVTGKLDTIEINANAYGAAVTIQIEPAAPLPTGAVLDKQSLKLNDTGWSKIALKTPPSVTAGSKYAIVLTKFTNVGWNGDCSDAYTHGGAYVFDTSAWYTNAGWAAANGASVSSYCVADYAFRPFVTKPAVSTAAPATPTAPPAITAAPATASAPVTATDQPTTAVEGATSAASPSGLPALAPATGDTTSDTTGTAMPIIVGGGIALVIALIGLGFLVGKRRSA